MGFTGDPFCITVKCRWQPVDQPVEPTYPTIWPRLTCWPGATIAGAFMWLVMVARPTPWWKPWSMMTRLPQAVWK